ncbi:MAG: class II aldolase/adducin family protein [Rhizomicrobium sp.]
MTNQIEVRKEMIATCLRMNAAGLNLGTAGNLSVRIEGGFLVTPSGIAYETMTPDQIVEMDFDERYYGNYIPSSEWRFHHAILKHRADANVVLHSHAVNCAILASCRLDIPAVHYMVATAGGALIKCSGYAPFGTEALSHEALAALGPRNACLLGNHGVVTLGATMAQAFALLEEVEYLARHYIGTRLLGCSVTLNEAEMNVVLERFKTYGKQADELGDLTGAETDRVVPPKHGGDRLP